MKRRKEGGGTEEPVPPRSVLRKISKPCPSLLLVIARSCPTALKECMHHDAVTSSVYQRASTVASCHASGAQNQYCPSAKFISAALSASRHVGTSTVGPVVSKSRSQARSSVARGSWVPVILLGSDSNLIGRHSFQVHEDTIRP